MGYEVRQAGDVAWLGGKAGWLAGACSAWPAGWLGFLAAEAVLRLPGWLASCWHVCSTAGLSSLAVGCPPRRWPVSVPAHLPVTPPSFLLLICKPSPSHRCLAMPSPPRLFPPSSLPPSYCRVSPLTSTRPRSSCPPWPPGKPTTPSPLPQCPLLPKYLACQPIVWQRLRQLSGHGWRQRGRRRWPGKRSSARCVAVVVCVWAVCCV